MTTPPFLSISPFPFLSLRVVCCGRMGTVLRAWWATASHGWEVRAGGQKGHPCPIVMTCSVDDLHVSDTACCLSEYVPFVRFCRPYVPYRTRGRGAKSPRARHLPDLLFRLPTPISSRKSCPNRSLSLPPTASLHTRRRPSRRLPRSRPTTSSESVPDLFPPSSSTCLAQRS